MRLRTLTLMTLLTSSPCLAQSAPAPDKATAPKPTPPAYTPVRWNEDYAYLKDPSQRTDMFDPIKRIPLNGDGAWTLSLGGQARYRYEYFDNFNFGAAGAQDDDGYHLARVLTHADARFGSNVRAFAQLISAGVEDRQPFERPGIDENDFDVHQAFVDLKLAIGDSGASVTLRGGRQNLLYGAQRLISPLDWTNTRRTFDGGKASLTLSKTHTLDAFYVNPVVVDEGPIDDSNDDDFAGLYDSIGLPTLIANAGSKLDLYALYLDKQASTFTEGTGEEERITVGARFFTNPRPWDLDVEAAYQFGDFADGDVSAWMFAAEGGYTFADAALAPRIYAGVDVASGDDDPTDGDLETFNQLYPLGHAYFGYIDVVGRQNIIDIHPGVELTLAKEKRHAKKLSLRADYHLFWRFSDEDALYNVAGAIQRNGGGSDERFVGSEIDLLLTWQVDRHLNVYAGYSHFFAGAFIDETGPDEDVDFLYGAVTFTF